MHTSTSSRPRASAPASVAAPAPVRADTTVPPDLEVLDLGKGFRSGMLRKKLRGIAGVSFRVGRGEVFALLGRNGAGKTTTINCVLNLMRPDTGQVTILGRDHAAGEARRGVGYLPERPYFFEHLSGRELLRFYGDLLDLPRRSLAAEIDRVLETVDMTAAADGRLSKMSKGMLQRMGLAQALLGDPQLLILDEPMSGLDPVGRREVRELLRRLRSEGRTILLSSHIVPDVEMLADTVGILDEGRLVSTVDRAEIAAAASYMVHAVAPAGPEDRWPDWLLTAAPETSGTALRVPAPDTGSLGRILAHCQADGVSVRSVETRHTGLEDLFMAITEQGSAP